MSEPTTPNKRQRREAARADRQAKEQAAAAAETRRKRLLTLGGLLGAAVVVVIVAIVISSSGGKRKTPSASSGGDVAGVVPDRFYNWLVRRPSAAPLPDEPPGQVDRECLALVDAASGKSIWEGAARYAQLHSARASGSSGIELLRGPDASHFRVLALSVGGNAVRASERVFEPTEWRLDGFSDEYLTIAASGGAFGETFSPAAAASAGAYPLPFWVTT